MRRNSEEELSLMRAHDMEEGSSDPSPSEESQVDEVNSCCFVLFFVLVVSCFLSVELICFLLSL